MSVVSSGKMRVGLSPDGWKPKRQAGSLCQSSRLANGGLLKIALIRITHSHLWLSRVKCGVLVALVCFELEVRLCPMGDEVLAM